MIVIVPPLDTPPVMVPDVASIEPGPLVTLHVPPPLGSLIVVVPPLHTMVGPVIAPGVWFTVTIVVTPPVPPHPLSKCMVAVPAAAP